jgi:hypothetical protein
MRRFFCSTLAALACLSLSTGAFAKPASSAPKVRDVLDAVVPNAVFNGFVRIVPKYFGPERASDGIVERPADPNQRVLIFDAVISDGRSQPYADDPTIRLADADGVAADTRSVEPARIILRQGSVVQLHVVFWAPKDFVPDRVVYACATANCKAMRMHLKR